MTWIYGLKQSFVKVGDFDLLGRKTNMFTESCPSTLRDAYVCGVEV